MADPVKIPVPPPSVEVLEKSASLGLEKGFVRVYNRSNRAYIHHSYVAPANSYVTVPIPLAEFWVDRYPKEILEASVAAKEVGGTQARLGELQTKADQITSERDALKAEREALKAEIAALQEQLTAPKAKKPASVEI